MSAKDWTGTIFRFGGLAAIALADADRTLSDEEGTARVIVVTGTTTASRTLIFPLVRGADWIVVNDTTGGFDLVVVGASGTRTSIKAGKAGVVMCDGGGFRQILLYGDVDPTWATRTHWYINKDIGNDANDGSQATQGAGSVGPLQTLTEHFRRIIAVGGYRAPSTVTVDVLTNTLATDEPRGSVNVYRASTCTGATVVYRGTSGVTSIRTGTFSATTAPNPATNVLQHATDSVGATWTSTLSNLATGKRVRNTTVGARNNSTFWPWKDETAGACLFSQPYAAINLALGALGQSMSSLSTSDTYVLEQLPILSGAWGINFNVDSAAGSLSTNTEAIQFVDLCMTDTGGTNVPVMAANAYSALTFYNCDLGVMRVRSPSVAYVNCRRCPFSSGLIDWQDDAGSTVIIMGGLTRRTLKFSGGAGVIDQRHAADGLFVLGPSSIRIASFQSNTYGVQFYSPGASALFLAFLGAREIYGSCALSVVGIVIGEGCFPVYVANTTGITITGTSANLGFGHAVTQKSYSDLPFVQADATKQSGMLLQ